MTLEPGDIVRIKQNPLTWEVVGVAPSPSGQPVALLKSGQTERKRTELLANLTIHRIGEPE